MIPDAHGKPESRKNDPEELARLLEIELAQKRAAWQSASARARKIRTASFLFLFFLAVATLLAFFFLLTQVNEKRMNQPRPTPAASP
jgi:hypothetical protein